MWSIARNIDVGILRIVIIGDTTGLAGDTSESMALRGRIVTRIGNMHVRRRWDIVVLLLCFPETTGRFLRIRTRIP
jgi:hypothetical protein